MKLRHALEAALVEKDAENKKLRKKVERNEKFWIHVLDTYQKMTDKAGLDIDASECAWEDYMSHPLELLAESEATLVRKGARIAELETA